MAWCWWGPGGEWMCYNEEDSRKVEDAFIRQTRTFILDTNGYQYVIDLHDMSQRNTSSGRKRQIWRCSDEVPDGVTLYTFTWDGEPYDLVTCAYLSICMAQGRATCSFYISRRKFTVDFREMFQRSTETGRLRSVALGPELKPIPRGRLGLRPEDVVMEHATTAEDTCSICLDGFADEPPVRLKLCRGHYFHRACVEQAFQRKSSCPVCSKIYQPLFGTQPPGQMIVRRRHDMTLPGVGFPGAIVIKYIFPHGIQKPEHYHPNAEYMGTKRVAYLPWTREGEQVAELLLRAFRHRLTFAIGRSATTGLEDCVIWNGIHHKTNVQGGPGNHGYPDSGYLQRVREELQAFGIS
ncbi:unnamed protein product [Ostreobium quekettii]|uniref:RING-type E3 ubiquitin transferase n=1 Tax=Ostreobium quekettii TaxID=121088 RepID=A0A8S1IWP5_9CHLO|nr:unnamed protein product [Ostreobium quekettii]